MVSGTDPNYIRAPVDITSRCRQHDKHSDFPLGPPQLMMAYTAEEQVDNALLRERDE